MNYAAQDKVKLAVTEMQIAERGQVTLPGYPNKRIGSSLNTTDTSSYDMALTPDQYGSFVYFKVDLGDAQTGGASISNVNINISPQGVQTELSLSTFSPTFGRFARSNADRLKRVGRDRLAANRRIRANMALRASFRGGGANAFDRAKAMGGGVQPQSTTIWFCGRYTGSDLVTKEVVANDAAAQSYFGNYTVTPGVQTYDRTAIMTMDGLLRPVSKDGDGSLPQYVSYRNHCGGSGNGYSVAPGAPLSGTAPISINVGDLDPLANPVSIDSNTVAQRGLGGLGDFGHDWEGVARSSATGMAVGTGSLSFDGPVGYTEDYRFLALRGPLMLQSWGYDTQGYPVPNAGGNTTRYDDVTNEFATNWLQKPQTWPVAPVDLRFDRRRGVWTTPPAFGLYRIRLRDWRSGGWGAEVIGGNDDARTWQQLNGLPNPDMRYIENIYFHGQVTATTGDTCYAYYDTESCTYWAIPASVSSGTGGGGAGSGAVSLLDRPYCTYTPSDALVCTDTACLALGWGLQADFDPTGTEISAPFYVGSRSEANRTDLIAIGAGLATEQGSDTCEKTFTLDMSCNTSDDCTDINPFCPSTGVRGFEWGPGLTVHKSTVTGQEESILSIRKNLTISDSNGESKGKYIQSIGLRCGLKVEDGDTTCGPSKTTQSQNCYITLDNTSDYNTVGHEIPVVCGIKCDADGIESITKHLVFSECGLFMGTRQDNGDGQPLGDIDKSFAGVNCEESSSNTARTSIATFPSP